MTPQALTQMPPPTDADLQSIRNYLAVNSRWRDKEDRPRCHAQWGRPTAGMEVVQTVRNVYDDPDANPSRVDVVTYSALAPDPSSVTVLLTQSDPDRGVVVGRTSLSLALAAYDVGLDLNHSQPQQACNWAFPLASPLDLLRQAQPTGVRFVTDGVPIRLPGQAPKGARWPAFRVGSLDAGFRPWLWQIQTWQTSGNVADTLRLLALTNNIHYEIRAGLRTFLLRPFDRVLTYSVQSNLRLLYREAVLALRKKGCRV